MDLSGLSDADVQALASGDMGKVSDEGLSHIMGGKTEPDYKGAAQAGSEHMGNAILQGYGPQAAAATEPLTTKIGDMMTGQNVSAQLPDYVHRRDENIQRLKTEEKNFPGSSTAGTVVGTLASSAPMGSAIMKAPAVAGLVGMAAPEGAGLAAKGLALAGRTAGAAASAGLQGLITNPGDTEGEVNPLQAEEHLKGGALSAAVAAPLSLGGEAVQTAGEYLGPKVKDVAERLAYRALGPFKRGVNQTGYKANEIGRAALDNGVIGWVPRSGETLADRAAEASKTAGAKLGSITDELSGLEGGAIKSGVSRDQIANNLKKELLVNSDIPGVEENNSKFAKWIEEFRQDPAVRKMAEKQDISYEDAAKLAGMSGYKQNQNPLTFKQLRQYKMDVGGSADQRGLIKWDRLKGADLPIGEEFHRALYGELKQGEEQGANAIEQAYYGQPTGRFDAAKDQFEYLKDATKLAEKRSEAQRANKLLGLRDAMVGTGGAALGGYLGYKANGYEGAKTGAEIGGAIGAVGNKLAGDFGGQISSKVTDSISKLLAQSPQLNAVVQKYPNVLPQLVQMLQAPKNRSSGSGTQSGGPQAPQKPDTSQNMQGQMPMDIQEARQKHREGN